MGRALASGLPELESVQCLPTEQPKHAQDQTYMARMERPTHSSFLSSFIGRTACLRVGQVWGIVWEDTENAVPFKGPSGAALEVAGPTEPAGWIGSVLGVLRSQMALETGAGWAQKVESQNPETVPFNVLQ